MGFTFSSRLTDDDRDKIQRALLDHHKKNEQIENHNKTVRKERREAKAYLKDMRKMKLKLTKDERQHIDNILSQKLQRPIPGNKLIKDLRNEGLSYSESSMYHDIRRSGAFAKAKTPEARQRAIIWFDNYFEKLRVEKGLTAHQAYKIWERAKNQSYENMTKSELEFALELREQGSP